MKYRNVKIAYYSGTGGTKMTAYAFARQLEDFGSVVEIQNITEGVANNPTWNDLMILLFPVYAFRAPEPVYRWIGDLKKGMKMPVAVISVSGGGEVWPNTACRRKVIKNLEARDYLVVYEEMAVMPSNIVLPTPSPAARILVDLVPDFVAGVLEDLEQGRMRRTNPGLANRSMACIGSVEKYGAHIFGRRIRVLEACSGCGTCAAQCPSGNIMMNNGKPIFGNKCFLCMKCFYNCPNHALTPGVGKFAVIKTGFDLVEPLPAATLEERGSNQLAKRSAGSLATKDQLEKIIPGVVWSGVRKYILETQAKWATRKGGEG